MQAQAITVYVNYPSDVTGYYLWAWDSNGNLNGDDYPGNMLTESVQIGGAKYMKFTTNATNFAVIVTDNEYNRTAHIEGITKDCYIKITKQNDYYIEGKKEWLYFRDEGYELNDTNFPDAKLRSALSTALGVNEGDSFYPSLVTSLELVNKEITNAKGIELFPNLQTLILDDNDLYGINLVSNYRLVTLSLKNNTHINGFSVSAGKGYEITLPRSGEPGYGMTALRTLDLSGCKITNLTALSSSTHNVTGLTWLSFAGCGLSAALSTGITNQTNLEYLDYSGNTLTGLGNITNLKKLKHLDLHDCGSAYSSVDVSNMKSLEYLDISGCDLSLTNQLNYIKTAGNVKKFISKNSNGGTFPASVIISSLKYLDLSGNKYNYTTANTIIAGLTSLDTLIFANNQTNNQLRYIRAKTNKLNQLKYLDLSNNELYWNGNQANELPASLETFIADNCSWSSVAPIQNLSNLKTVSIKAAQTTSQEISNCPALESVDVSGNVKITTLAVKNNRGMNDLPVINVTGCTALATLDVSDNELYSLDAGKFIGLGSSLTTLNCSSNNLCAINLEDTDLNDNITINASNQSRKFVSESGLYQKGDVTKYFYFLQLEDGVENGGNYFAGTKSPGRDKTLAEDGLDLDKVTWDPSYTIIEGTKGNGSSKIAVKDFDLDNPDPSGIYGKVLWLGTDAKLGTLNYTYDTGKGNAEFALGWQAPEDGVVTAIVEVESDAQPVSSVYYNLAGQASDTPHKGVNIVVTTMSDGSTTSTKVIK